MAKTVLEMRDISKSFPGVKALDHMQLSVREGEVHALMGENGAGKSTLMNILDGSYPMDTGTILIDGNEVQIRSVRDAIRNGISMIHQELNYVPALSVAANIFLGKEIMTTRWLREREMIAQAQKLLDRMGVHVSAKKKMNELSMAQQQMVEIVRAVSNNARIIIMDEPTSAITSEEVEILFEIIEQLKADHVATIFITHKMDEIYRIADCVTIMRDGNYIGTLQKEEMESDRIVSMMVGRSVNDMFPKFNHPTEEEIFRVENLTGGKFRNISFSVNRGEILGVAGLMGAGRTEVMRAIFGLDPLKSGKIFLNGKELRIRNSRQAIEQGIGYVSEDRRKVGLVLGMSVKDNITMSSLRNFCSHTWILKKKEQKTAAEQVKEYKIKTPGTGQLVGNLSGGNQQKVVLSKTMLCDPEILILDEPTRGIDVGAKAEIHRMISELANQGKAIIMISSEMPEVLGMSDRVLVIHEGVQKGILSGGKITQEDVMKTIML